MARTGVPKTVRTTAWHPDVQRTESTIDHMVHATRREWTKRRSQRQEEFAASAGWPYLLEVLHDCITDCRDEGILLGTTLLCTLDCNDLTSPIEVLET